MAKKTVKRRDWTKEDIRTLKTLAREKTKTTVIARRLKRSVGALYTQASGENEYLPIRPIIALAPARCCAHSTQPRSLAGQRHSLGASTTAFPVIARNRIAWLQLRRSVAAHPIFE
jgi:hypothetical protein